MAIFKPKQVNVSIAIAKYYTIIQKSHYKIPFTMFYISGKITGVKDLNLIKFLAERDTIYRIYGYVNVIVPQHLPSRHDKSWQSYMKVCIPELVKCNEVVVLDDWTRSRGAITEVLLAKVLAIPVIKYNQVAGCYADVQIGRLKAVQLFIKVLLNRF